MIFFLQIDTKIVASQCQWWVCISKIDISNTQLYFTFNVMVCIVELTSFQQKVFSRWCAWWRHYVSEKRWLPPQVMAWMEFESLLLRFLHYTYAKMCLSGKELNNDRLGHNKHMINRLILLGRTLEGRVGRVTGNVHFFYFAYPFQLNVSLNTPNQIYCKFPPPWFKLFMPPLELLHLIFSQSESDKPILSNHNVSDLWPADAARTNWSH